MLKKILFLVLTVAAPAVWAADAAGWKLLPQVQADGAGVFLDQLVTATGTNVPPHIRLARAPQAGQAASFTRSQILAMAQIVSPGLAVTNLDGAFVVHISRRCRSLEDAELMDLLSTTLQKDYIKNQGELELSLTRIWAPVQVPDEPLTLKVAQMPGRGVSSAFILTFELFSGHEYIGRWQVALHASVWRDIPIAHSELTRGESLKDADVTMERSDILVQRDVFLNFPTINDALEICESVPPGHPILSRDVRTRPLITRGQMVEAVFRDGSLEISLTVETLEDGALGQTVRVRNPKTRRELYAKVESEKSVRITL